MSTPLPALGEIPGAVQHDNCNGWIINWEITARHLRASDVEETDKVYTDLAKQWLQSIAEAWGAGFRLYESDNILVLSARGGRLASNLAQLAERTIGAMTAKLAELAAKPGHGKFVCIVTDSLDRYYSYLERFYTSGEFGASAGVFLRGGYSHFVLNYAEPCDQEYTLVHELTHAVLQERDLPPWLEEGITQLMEESILGGSNFLMNREEAQRHREHWMRKRLQTFWHGTSFTRANDPLLSYSLAQMLVRNMLSRGRTKFVEFATQAKALDCGDEASRSVYGISLCEWAAQFLGPGDWSVAAQTPEEP